MHDAQSGSLKISSGINIDSNICIIFERILTSSYFRFETGSSDYEAYF